MRHRYDRQIKICSFTKKKFAILLQFHYFFTLVEYDPRFREECRSYDTYSMVLTYFLASSLLFCFTMSFLFSLCIVGSPLLRDVYNDNQAFRQRYLISLNISFSEYYKVLLYRSKYIWNTMIMYKIRNVLKLKSFWIIPFFYESKVAITFDTQLDQQFLHNQRIFVEFQRNISVCLHMLWHSRAFHW